MDLSIVHYRTASTRDGLPTMSKRAWCSLKFRQSISSSSRAEICSFCQRLIIRADLLSPTRVAILGLFASSTAETVAFPCYDGNGMFYSMGNLLGNRQVGMLFVNFEKPHRLRLQGNASVDDNDPLLQEYSEAQLVVRVTVTEISAIALAMCTAQENSSV